MWCGQRSLSGVTVGKKPSKEGAVVDHMIQREAVEKRSDRCGLHGSQPSQDVVFEGVLIQVARNRGSAFQPVAINAYVWP